MSERRLHIKRVQCAMCDDTFSGDVVQVAKNLADHWNMDHDDDLHLDMKEYDRDEYIEEQLHGHDHRARVYRYFVTAYDILDSSGHSAGPFAWEYVEEPEADDHCEDCWRSLDAVDGYREINDDGWRTQYRCDECYRERNIERRKNENQSLTEFNA